MTKKRCVPSPLWFPKTWKQGYLFPLIFLGFVILSILSSVLWYTIESTQIQDPLPFINYLFTSISLLTQTGLVTVRFYNFSYFGQVSGLILIFLGGLVTMNLLPLAVKILRSFRRMMIEKSVNKSLEMKEFIVSSKPSFRRKKKMCLEGESDGKANRRNNEELKESFVKRKVKLRVGLLILKFLGLKKIEESEVEFLSLVFLLIWIVYLYVDEILVGTTLLYSFIVIDPCAANWEAAYVVYISFFISVSSLNNAGALPLVTGLFIFRSNPGVNIVVVALILLGNTWLSAFLRCSISLFYLGLKKAQNRILFKYILDNHHHLSIHLFPREQTLVYFSISVFFNLFGAVFHLLLVAYYND